MVFFDASIRGSSPIQPIIQRSAFAGHDSRLRTRIEFVLCRVLLATIRDLGNCPCPRCRILKEAIRNVGSAEDMASRSTSQRVDNPARQGIIAKARRLIYGKGLAVKTPKVEKILFAESWVPTMVRSVPDNLTSANIAFAYRTPSPRSSSRTASTFTPCLLLI